MNKKVTTLYSSKVWLNEEASPSTGNVCAYDGRIVYDNQEYVESYLRISDCRKTIVLHKADYDERADFIAKMELLHNEIGKFIEHLKSTENELTGEKPI